MNKNKGITLITLIVTITILLILAGVSIGVVVNSNFFDKAQDTVQKANKDLNDKNNQEEEIQNNWDQLPGETIKGGTKTPENGSFTLKHNGRYIGTYKFTIGETWRSFIGYKEWKLVEGGLGGASNGVCYAKIINDIAFCTGRFNYLNEDELMIRYSCKTFIFDIGNYLTYPYDSTYNYIYIEGTERREQNIDEEIINGGVYNCETVHM